MSVRYTCSQTEVVHSCQNARQKLKAVAWELNSWTKDIRQRDWKTEHDQPHLRGQFDTLHYTKQNQRLSIVPTSAHSAICSFGNEHWVFVMNGILCIWEYISSVHTSTILSLSWSQSVIFKGKYSSFAKVITYSSLARLLYACKRRCMLNSYITANCC